MNSPQAFPLPFEKGARGRRLLFAVTLPLLLWPATARPEADLERLARGAALRWENVQGPPAWVSGPEPRFAPDLGYCRVELAPGEAATVRVPAGESLRVQGAGQPLQPADLAAWISGGTGLWAPARVQHDAAQGALRVLPLPSPSGGALVRLERPAASEGRAAFGLFLPVREPALRPEPSRERFLVPDSAERAAKVERPGIEVPKLGTPEPAELRPFALLAPGEPLSLRVAGPAHLTLETRLLYPEGEPQSFQPYRVEARLNGAPLRVLEHETSFDGRDPLLLDGRPATLARPDRGYLEIPPGDYELSLLPSAPVLASLWLREAPGYLFPRWNRPREAERPAPHRSPLLDLPLWQIEPLSPTLLQPAADPTVRERVALRLARDGEHRDGGALAYPWMEEAAARHPEEPALADAAQELRGFHTFYRDLLPVRKLTPGAPELAWFPSPRLRELEEDAGLVAAPEQLAGDFLDKLPAGWFVEVPVRRHPEPLPATHVYLLPDLPAPTLLRVAVDLDSDSTGAGRELWLQVDREPPVLLRTGAGRDLPEAEYVPGPGELGLELLRWRQAGKDGGTLGGPFAAGREAARLLRAGVAELRLPARARQVQVWQEPDGRTERLGGPGGVPARWDDPEHPQRKDGPNVRMSALSSVSEPDFSARSRAGVPPRRTPPGPPQSADTPEPDQAVSASSPLRIALQVRVSRPHELSETAFLELQRRLDQRGGASEALVLSVLGVGKTLGDPEGRDLANAWLPLVRILKACHESFAASLVPAPVSTDPGLSEAEAARLERVARQEESARRWVEALSLWSRAAHAAVGEARERAEAARGRLLFFAGEEALAERALRSLVLYAEHDGPRQEARGLLAERYRRAGDRDALLTLAAVEALRRPSVESLRAVIEPLLEEGAGEAALLAGLALPEGQRPHEALLRAALGQRWFRVVERLAATHPDPSAPERWAGHAAAAQGDFDAALTHFQRAGDAGAPWARSLEEGLSVRRELLSTDPRAREAALGRWASWQASHPGPTEWREEAGLIADFGASAALYTPARDLWAQGFLASAEQPLRLQALGPAQLRFEARPVHRARQADPLPLEGWVRVRTQDRLWVAPFSGNLPTSAVSWLGEEEREAGWSLAAEVPLGPGMHELEVSGGSLPLFVRAFAARPALPLGVLPPLSLRSAGAAAAGSLVDVAPEPVAQPSAEAPATLAIPVDRARAAELLRRRNEPRYPDAPALQGFPAPPAPKSAQTLAEQEASLLAAEDLPAALALPAGEGDDDLRRRMTLLAWAAEEKPDLRPDLAVQANALAAANPGLSGVGPLLARIEGQASWNLVRAVDRSAGVRTVTVPQPDPESPGSRLRTAILPGLEPGEQLLIGDGELVAAFANLRPARVRLGLKAEDLDRLPSEPLRAWVRVDDGPTREHSLVPGAPWREVFVELPAGQHAVRVGLRELVANQVVRARLEEPGRPPWTLSAERLYHVATASEPVSVELEGPAWVRIDRRAGDETRSEYRQLGPGWQPVEVGPGPGAREALVRIFVRTALSAGEPLPATPRVRHARPAYVAVPDSPLQPTWPAPAEQVAFHDGQPLGRQKNGTWSATAALVRRRGLGADTADSGRPDHFLELAADYRASDTEETSYQRTTVLGRARWDSGPTLGLRQELWQEPGELFPAAVRLEASAYAQALGGKDSDPPRGALFASGALSRRLDLSPETSHTPELAVFGRLLSHRRSNGADRMDRDVFTAYKADHLSGLTASETLTHRPWRWQDTLWLGGASATSNELQQPTPDHWQLWAGWNQLLGPFQVDGRARYLGYFSDSDRDAYQSREMLELEGSWEGWREGRHRIEARAGAGWELSTGEVSGLISFTWHFDEGKAYRDFRPGEVGFRNLRERRIPPKPENTVEELP